MNSGPEVHEGFRLLRALSRKLVLFMPPHMERDDLIHAGWIALKEARSAGKGWGWVKRAVWGEMINEMERWYGVPSRWRNRVHLVPLSPSLRQSESTPSGELPSTILSAITTLPKRQRQVVQAMLNGERQVETARSLGISQSNVQTHLHHAINALRGKAA